MKENKYKHTKIWVLLFLCWYFPFCGLQAQQKDSEKPARIWNVKIEGNNTYKDIVLKDYIANEAPSFWKKLTFFNEKKFYVNDDEIKKDVIRIERFYQRRGFNDVEVTYRLDSKNKEWKKELIFMVVENSPIRISNVDIKTSASPKDSTIIYSNSKFSNELDKLPYSRQKIYQPILKTQVESDVSQILRNLGYPYANTEIEAKVDTAAKKADVFVNTTPGPRATFDSILVEGETTLPAKYIRRETGIKKGSYFNDHDLREAQRELFGHHLFRFALVSIPEQEQDSTINILLRIKERKLRSVSLIFGIGNYDRFQNGFSLRNTWNLFRTQATWRHRNMRNRGELLTLSAKYSTYDMHAWSSYQFPYIFNTKSNITVAPFARKRIERAYSIATGGLRNTFGYNYNESITGTFSYDFTLNREFDVQEDEFGNSLVSPDSVLNYNISSFKFNVYVSQGLPNGGDGFVIQPFLELSGLFQESTFSFQKASLDIRGYKKLTKSLIGAARLNGGAIYYAKQDSLPSDIRFYNGGSSDVRGWGRQDLGPKEAILDSTGTFTGYVPIGGKASFNFNVELRQQVNKFIKGLSVAAFLDGGQVWRTIRTTKDRPIQFGVGGGLRYKSPIGPIRLDLAYKLNPTDADLNIYQGNTSNSSAWNRWGIHFSIGQAF